MSFLQTCDINGLYMETGHKVIMHDLMHDLACLIAENHRIKICRKKEDLRKANNSSYRYVSFSELKEDYELRLDGKVRAIYLNSYARKLNDKSFSQATNLRVLEDESNRRHILNSIGNLKKLRYFSFSGVKALDQNFILPNLQYFYIKSDRINALPNCIGKFKSLQYLELSNCFRLKLPDCFGNLKDLKYIDFSNCFHLELPACFGSLQNLEHLNFSNSSGLELPECFGNLQNLRHLDFSGCSKLELPECFGNLQNLRHLNLSRCSNLELPECFGNLQNLGHLDLSGCSNLELPECFGSLRNLRHLELSGCSNLILPECFGKLQNLMHLDLSGCSNLKLPEFIDKLQNLRHLDLSGCPHLELPECFGNLQNLKYLDLSGCLFLKLPESFGRRNNLVTSAFYSSRDFDIPGLLGHLTSLKHLLLQKGCFSSSSMKEIRQFTNLETLQMNIDFTVKEEEEYVEGEECIKKCCNIVCLKNMNMLQGRLIIRGLENVKDPKDAEEANLKEKYKLDKLELYWFQNRQANVGGHAAVLESLRPSSSFKSNDLKISGYQGSRWPSWLKDCRRLILEDVNHDNLIQQLGLMPNLTYLSLRYIQALEKIYLRRNQDMWFPFLEELHMEHMDNLDELLCEDEGRTCLRIVRIGECPKLTTVSLPPSTMELSVEIISGVLFSSEGTIKAPSLQRLTINSCKNLVAFSEWLGELSSLESLVITHCPLLESLPDNISKLTRLRQLQSDTAVRTSRKDTSTTTNNSPYLSGSD